MDPLLIGNQQGPFSVILVELMQLIGAKVELQLVIRSMGLFEVFIEYGISLIQVSLYIKWKASCREIPT